MTSYEVVERGAACAVIDHRLPQPLDGQRLQDQVAHRRGGRPGHPGRRRGGHRATARGEPPPRRPFDDAEAAGLVERFDPFAGYEALRAPHAGPRPPAGRRPARPGRSALRLGCRLDRPRCWRAAASSSTRSTASATPGSAASTRSPSGPTSTRRWPASATGGYDLGLLLDGDADRAGRGRRAGHLHPPARSAWACSCTTCSSIAASARRSSRRSTRPRWSSALGERYGVPVHETPVGFKYVGPKMIETGAMMGGEESGGYGFGMHLPERDGIYADLLLLDLFVREREAGRWPVSEAVAHLHDIAGPSFYLRDDVHATGPRYPALKARLLRRARRAGAGDAGRAAGGAHGRPGHRRRLQVLGRRRLLAAGPLQRHGAAGPRLRRGEQRGAARCAAWPRVAAWCRA